MKKRIKSFQYAFNGLRILFYEEPNARIHLAAAVLALIAGLILKISVTEWIIVLSCITLVFVCEIINTAIENLCDFVSPEKHELIKKSKDLAAAAVLIAALFATIIGVIIFIPKIWWLIYNPSL